MFGHMMRSSKLCCVSQDVHMHLRYLEYLLTQMMALSQQVGEASPQYCSASPGL